MKQCQKKIKCLFYSTRRFVRLGEHDISTEDDEHQDFPVVHVERHASFSPKWKINDIAVLYLQRDVEFDGASKSILCADFFVMIFHIS